MIGAPAPGAADRAMLHADAAAALAVWERHAPAAATRARCALERLIRRARGAPAWTGSRLTGDGYPVEFVFAFDSERVRYTVDPMVGGCDAGGALDESLAFVGQLPTATADALAWLRRARAGAELRYGAWIGGSHDATEDRFKLYVEVPPGLQHGRGATSRSSFEPIGKTAAEGPWSLLEQAATVRMIGIEVTTGQVEVYWRTRRLETHDLARLLAARGLRHRAAHLIGFVEHEFGRPIDGRIPGSPAGLSESVDPGGTVVAVTLFVFARTLWGGDSRIRQRLRALTRGTAMGDAYHEITAPLAHRDVYRTYHGLLGITVSADGELRLSVGVRPPPVRRD